MRRLEPVKWAALVLALVLGGLYAASRFRCTAWLSPSAMMVLGDGGLWFVVPGGLRPWPQGVVSGWHPCRAIDDRSSWHFDLPELGTTSHLTLWRRTPRAHEITLLVPLIPIATSAGLLWWLTLRARPGHCRSCRYDLRGLPHGQAGSLRCPECGTAAPQGPTVAP